MDSTCSCFSEQRRKEKRLWSLKRNSKMAIYKREGYNRLPVQVRQYFEDHPEHDAVEGRFVYPNGYVGIFEPEKWWSKYPCIGGFCKPPVPETAKSFCWFDNSIEEIRKTDYFLPLFGPIAKGKVSSADRLEHQIEAKQRAEGEKWLKSANTPNISTYSKSDMLGAFCAGASRKNVWNDWIKEYDKDRRK
jgi:hypothetical protein